MKISDITTVVTGGTPSTKNKAFWENGTIPWLQSGVCKNGYVDTCSKYITQAGLDNSSAKMMPAGTVIIALTGATVGKVGLLRIEACANQSVTGIIPNDSFLPLYMFYYLLSIRGKIIHDSYGDAQPHISQQYVKDIDIPLPSLAEQEKIVEWIEELFSELDSGVETLNKTKAQLVVYRQAVLKEAFEGNLTKQYRTNNSFHEWQNVSIMQLIEEGKHAIKAGPFGSALKKECYVPSGYKIYGQEQVIAGDETIGDYYIDESKYKELINCKVAPDDILISLVGTVGKVLILSQNCQAGIINPRLIKVTLDKSKMLPRFFKYYFESAYLKSLYKEKAHGATMDVINLGMIKELPFPLCDLCEQKQVISEIESRLSVCDSIEQTVNIALQQAEAMRQSILKQAFEGRL